MIRGQAYHFQAEVWLYQGAGAGAWHFITLPPDISAEIKCLGFELKRGWGSMRVKAKIGETAWKTSIFPDKKLGAYILPLKADVRKHENIGVGDKIDVTVTVE